MTDTPLTACLASTWTEKEINFLKKAIHILQGKAERVALYFVPPKTKDDVLKKLEELNIDVQSICRLRKYDRGTHALFFKDFFPPQEFYRATSRQPSFDISSMNEASVLLSSLHSSEHLDQMSSILSSYLRKNVGTNASLEYSKIYDFLASAYEANEDLLAEKFRNMSSTEQNSIRVALAFLQHIVCSSDFQVFRNRIQRQCQVLHRVSLPHPFQDALDHNLSSSYLLGAEMPSHRKLFNPLPIRKKMRQNAFDAFKNFTKGEN